MTNLQYKTTQFRKMILDKYSHIIWDWNGTLLNDAWLCVDVMNNMLTKRDLPLITLEIYRNIFDFPVRDYYLKLGYDFDVESFEKVGMEFMILYNQRQKECSLHTEAVFVLDAISKLGLSQSILSAREQNELRLETTDLGVSRFFEKQYGLDDHYAHGKTDVGIKLLDDLKVPKEKVIFIGDTRHDSEVADELGIDCVLIPMGHHSLQRLESCNKRIIQSINELPYLS
jgi:phosphoglycolate phosphatase